MRTSADFLHRRRITALLAAGALVALAVATGVAAVRPRVDSPHGKFREECSMCHTADTWKVAKVQGSFDHSKYGFRLAGAHAAAGCLSCHTSLEFAKAATQCATCHTDPHRGELGTECARCHNDRSFIDRGPMLRAHQLTRFPLTGGHSGLDCESCHRPAAQGRMQFVGTRAECEGCHMDDYAAAKSPDHAAAGYPLECRACHATSSWDGAKFNHASTGFTLTGAHRAAACASCHVDDRYAGTPRDCASCHMTEYNAATPNHLTSGFAAASCATCHNTTAWEGATVDHNAFGFPLTGAHAAAECAGCHGGGVYAGTPKDCFSCHATEYNAAVPNHASAGFTTGACATCHNTTTWSGATFDHDGAWFPIDSGKHAGKWAACTDCHTNAANYTVFTCLSCHPHSDKTKTDEKHSGRRDYQYLSSACYSCHPRGN